MPELVELRRKSGQRGLLITGYKRLKKDSDRAITPAMEAVCVPAHLALPGSPQAKQLHHLHSQPSLGQSATGKKVLRLCAQGHFGHVALFATLWTVACQVSLSGMGVLQVRTLECIDQYLLPYPSRALYFLLP